MREIGLGCNKDMADAIKLHEEAAARGHGQACYRLGGFYDDGIGVAQDAAAALRWYERGRELGDPNATGCCASEATRHFCAVARAETRKRVASRPVWKSKFYGAFVLNRRVVLHAIDATPARWCGDADSSPLDGASTAASLVDFHTGEDDGPGAVARQHQRLRAVPDVHDQKRDGGGAAAAVRED